MIDPTLKAANNAEIDLLDSHVQELRKRYDTVEIFVSRRTTVEDMSIGRDLGHTLTINRGDGNWFARYGQIHIWLECEIERERANARRETEE